MKRIFSFSLLMLFFLACDKDNIPGQQPGTPRTRLSVNVTDTSGNAVQGADVILYICGFPALPSLTTDINGNALFDSIPYSGLCTIMIGATKGFYSNRNHLTALSIVSQQLNQYNAIIYETGTLKIQIDSCDTYTLTSSVYTGPISGCSTYHFFPDTGPFSFRSALETSPGIYKDTVVQIIAGDTTDIILPY